MVEATRPQHSLAHRLLRFFAYTMAGGIIAQIFCCLVAYLLIYDSQAAGMIANLVTQHLAYYFLGCAFGILSFTNVLIKRGLTPLRRIRLPSLVLILTISSTSFLLIPRMDYLRETALLDGMPVMLSHFANYFQILNVTVLLLLITQIISSIIIAWRLSA